MKQQGVQLPHPPPHPTATQISILSSEPILQTAHLMVERVNDGIPRINRNPVNKCYQNKQPIHWLATHPMDNDINPMKNRALQGGETHCGNLSEETTPRNGETKSGTTYHLMFQLKTCPKALRFNTLPPLH